MSNETMSNAEVSEVLGENKPAPRLVEIKQVAVKLDTGNFTIIVSGFPTAKYIADKIHYLMKYDIQRTPATKAYLELGGVPNKKGDKLVFPDGFERESVEFNDKTRQVMLDRMTNHFKSLLDDCRVHVTRHIKEETDDGRATAQAKFAEWSANGTLTKKLAVLDFDGDEDNEDEVVEFIHEQLVKRQK